MAGIREWVMSYMIMCLGTEFFLYYLNSAIVSLHLRRSLVDKFTIFLCLPVTLPPEMIGIEPNSTPMKSIVWPE